MLLREIMATPNMVMLLGNHEYMMLDYPKSLLTHLEVEINGKRYYLVHGFPGANVYDEVWHRPKMDTPNPIPGCQLIIGHTPVLSFIKPEEQVRYAIELESRGEHLRGSVIQRVLPILIADAGTATRSRHYLVLTLENTF